LHSGLRGPRESRGGLLLGFRQLGLRLSEVRLGVREVRVHLLNFSPDSLNPQLVVVLFRYSEEVFKYRLIGLQTADFSLVVLDRPGEVVNLFTSPSKRLLNTPERFKRVVRGLLEPEPEVESVPHNTGQVFHVV